MYTIPPALHTFVQLSDFLNDVSRKPVKTHLENVFGRDLEQPVCQKVGRLDLFGCRVPGYPKRKYGVRLAQVRISNF